MKIKLIKTHKELIKIKGSWNDMVRKSQFDTPFYSWAWYEMWWKHFGDVYELYIIIAENISGQLLSIAPLMKFQTKLRGIKVTELSFIDNGIGPRNSILHRNDASGYQSITTIVEYLATHNHEWDYIKLDKIDKNSSFLNDYEKCMEKFNLKVIKMTSGQSPYLKIDTDFETYLLNTFKRKQRYNIKREAKKLSGKDGYKLICFTKPHEMKKAVDLSFQISKASWKGDIGTDMTSSEPRKAFYVELTNHLAQLGQIQIWILIIEDNPVALEYQLVNGKNIYLLISDFDESYKKLSPGTSLLYNILEKCYEDKLYEFDFCGGAYGYKLKWANGARELISYQIFSNKINSNLIYISKNKVLPILRRIKSIFKG